MSVEISSQKQDSFNVKPFETNHHPFYSPSTFGTQQKREQRISQNVDYKSIGILITGKALVILVQFFHLTENRYFILSNLMLFDFIFVISLTSIDFWVNKNIFGKKLAGLRWWVQVNQISQQQEWIFQSADPEVQINKINSLSFWVINLATSLFWFVNLIATFIRANALFWIGLCLFCFGIHFINLLCFYKCQGKHQKKIQQIIQKVGLKSANSLLNRTQTIGQESLHRIKFDIQ